MIEFLPIIFLICLALAFDFINGFHDAANSISTVIATGTLKPRTAVILAGIFNIVGLFIFHLSIAATIGKGIVDPVFVDFYVIGAALASAIVWNLITWAVGLPSSSSHALIGGVIGAVVAKVGWIGVIPEGIEKVAAFIIISPIVGLILGYSLNWILKRIVPHKAESVLYRHGQIISSCLYSIGHGANDAQKTAGIIFLILIAGGLMQKTDDIPYWVAMISFLVMGLGTLAGGWRIIRTMGYKITKLKQRGGFSAEVAGSTMLFTSAALGIPVSTTHTITGSIVGVGLSETKKVKWKTIRKIVFAWFLTIPAAGVIAASFYIFTKIL